MCGIKTCCGCIMGVLCAALLATLLVALLAKPSSDTYDGDEMLATETVYFNPETRLHNGVVVTATPAVTVAYKFSSAPAILNTLTPVTYTRQSEVEARDMSKIIVPLLPGSSGTITLRTNTTDPVVSMAFLVLRGHKEYKRYCRSGIDAVTPVAHTTGIPASLAFTATEEDDYYVVADNAGTDAAYGLVWGFDLKKASFDLSNYTDTCPAGQERCRFSVSKHDKVVVVVPLSVGFQSPVQVHVEEEFDDDIWWTIFGVALGVLGLLFVISLLMCLLRLFCGLCKCLFCCGCCCCTDSDDEEKLRQPLNKPYVVVQN